MIGLFEISTGLQMPEIITYSLRASHTNSDEYYQTISAFSAEVLAHAYQQVAELLGPFQSWSQPGPPTSARNREEVVLELLSLGVLWRIYTPSALASRTGARRTLAWLVALRKRSAFLKPGVDVLRGWLGGLSYFNKNPNLTKTPLTLKNMDILLEWLGASSEFSEEVKSLVAWRDFFVSGSPVAVSDGLQEAVDLAGLFESRSLERLGEYTANVESFLTHNHPRYRWREDNLFTGRQRLEYHLSMLATEILNRSFRQRFLGTDQKIVIVPPCMKAKRDEECLATSTPYGERCANCTPGCRVNQVTRLGEKHGFQVFIIPDDLKTFSGDQSDPAARHSVGLVGISCPLTNASGGWEMQRLGVPAQGLLLDYCGCSYHWHKDRIPTDINFQQLLRLVVDTANP